nr:MAG TPA: hypothetical protein [Caudoviricetes sp.]
MLNTRVSCEQRAKYARYYSRLQGCCIFCNSSPASSPPGASAAALSCRMSPALRVTKSRARACPSGGISS